MDNGSGIAPDDYESIGESPLRMMRQILRNYIGLKHHTSKLASFEGLTSVVTFGFRGEAISSLCAMSESVTVTTAIASEAPMGTVIELDRSGRVVSKDAKVARQVRHSVNTCTIEFMSLLERYDIYDQWSVQTSRCPSERI